MSVPSAAPVPFVDVLVVDDDADIRDLLTEYFHDRRISVASAHNGRAAIDALERSGGRFGLVVTDLSMPGADGFAVLKAARAANPSCYVVIMTGYASLDSAIQAVRLGAYDYLTKPFALGQIDIVVQRIRDRVALEYENRQLSRHAGSAPPAPSSIDARLDAIEERLDALVALVSRLQPR